MRREGIDGLLVFSPENMCYLTGYDSMGYVFYHVLLVPAEGELTILIPPLTERVLKETSFIKDYRVYRGDPIKQTADILAEKSLLGKVVGIEKKGYGLTIANYESLIASLSNKCTIADASDLIVEIRMIKSLQEVEYIKEAGRLADLAVQSAFSLLREGKTELEFSAEIHRALVSNGSGYSAFPLLISSGPRAHLNMYCNTANRKINKGDTTAVEFAGIYNRYHALIARTAVVGKPRRRVTELYRNLQEVNSEACIAIRSGIQVGEIHSTIQNAFAKRNIKQWSASWGYGVGLAYPPSWVEGEPFIQEGGHFTLQPGMVFFLHPRIVLAEESIGLRLADTFLITEDGYERITNASREIVWE